MNTVAHDWKALMDKFKDNNECHTLLNIATLGSFLIGLMFIYTTIKPGIPYSEIVEHGYRSLPSDNLVPKKQLFSKPSSRHTLGQELPTSSIFQFIQENCTFVYTVFHSSQVCMKRSKEKKRNQWKAIINNKS